MSAVQQRKLCALKTTVTPKWGRQQTPEPSTLTPNPTATQACPSYVGGEKTLNHRTIPASAMPSTGAGRQGREQHSVVV